jgi:hypothetical protein
MAQFCQSCRAENPPAATSCHECGCPFFYSQNSIVEITSNPVIFTIITFAPALAGSLVLLLLGSENYLLDTLLALVIATLTAPSFYNILRGKEVSLPVYYITIKPGQPRAEKILACVALALPCYLIPIASLLR